MDLILLKLGDRDLAAKVPTLNNVSGKNKDDYSNCIELVSMSFGMQQQMTTDVSNSARTSGRPILNDISLVKVNDQSSLILYESCALAKPLGAGKNASEIFVLRRRNVDNGRGILENVFTLELSNAMISSIETHSSKQDVSLDSFTINFTDIKWVYYSQADDPMFQNKADFGWSVSRNRPF